MIAWVIKTETDDDGEPNRTIIHAYRKNKSDKKGKAMPETLCHSSVNWKASNENHGYSFTPGFPPGEKDNVCKTCKQKATPKVKAT
jgi:hypothetical protein